jgi:hypothetical protein
MPLLALAALAGSVAVLPLAPAAPDMAYQVLPSRGELAAMTAQLRAGVGSARVIDGTRVSAAVHAAGFDQGDYTRACAVADCARRIGRALHARRVVFGTVTRLMAVVWSTDVALLDVRSGRTIAELQLGYKSDVLAMENGEEHAGSCIMRRADGRPPCPPDPGW